MLSRRVEKHFPLLPLTNAIQHYSLCHPSITIFNQNHYLPLPTNLVDLNRIISRKLDPILGPFNTNLEGTAWVLKNQFNFHFLNFYRLNWNFNYFFLSCRLSYLIVHIKLFFPIFLEIRPKFIWWVVSFWWQYHFLIAIKITKFLQFCPFVLQFYGWVYKS